MDFVLARLFWAQPKRDRPSPLVLSFFSWLIFSERTPRLARAEAFGRLEHKQAVETTCACRFNRLSGGFS
jgi:hypothetical protein